MDWDQGMEDENLGRCQLSVEEIQDNVVTDSWIPLEEATSGEVRIATEWLDLSTDTEDYHSSWKEAQALGLSSAVLMVHIDSCRSIS